MTLIQNSIRGRLVILEGLSGVGKSTTASIVAELLDAQLLPSMPKDFEHVVEYVADGNSAWSRFYTFLAGNYAICPEIEVLLACGCDVVIDSFFYRTLSTHAAMGITHLPEIHWGKIVKPDLVVLLTLEEVVRKRRIIERDGGLPKSKWHSLVEENLSVAQEQALIEAKTFNFRCA